MERRIIATVVLGAVLASCAVSTSSTVPRSVPDGASSVVATSPAHTPHWITVKYRSAPVDVADPRFGFLDGVSSSVVDAAFYDAGNEYMIISLNGTTYHYCETPSDVWFSFSGASSLGSFYNTRIKGRFDCRNGIVPEF